MVAEHKVKIHGLCPCAAIRCGIASLGGPTLKHLPPTSKGTLRPRAQLDQLEPLTVSRWEATPQKKKQHANHLRSLWSPSVRG